MTDYKNGDQVTLKARIREKSQVNITSYWVNIEGDHGTNYHLLPVGSFQEEPLVFGVGELVKDNRTFQTLEILAKSEDDRHFWVKWANSDGTPFTVEKKYLKKIGQ